MQLRRVLTLARSFLFRRHRADAVLAAALLLLVSTCAVLAQAELPQVPDIPEVRAHGYTQLIFHDDFREGRANMDPAWFIQHYRQGREGDGRAIRPYNQKDAVTFKREFRPNARWERLILRAYSKTRRGRVDKWITGKIDTRPRFENGRLVHRGFEHLYGYIEARIKFETQRGQNAAFWLLSRWNKTRNWSLDTKPDNWDSLPQQQRQALLEAADRDFNTGFGNEVDIIEAPRGSGRMIMNIHWAGGPRSRNHRATGRTVDFPPGSEPLQGNYHIYGLLWTPVQYIFYLDGREMWRTDPVTESRWVSHRPEFLLLTTDVNDDSDEANFYGRPPRRGYGNRRETNALVHVKWVRWWSDTDVRTEPLP